MIEKYKEKMLNYSLSVMKNEEKLVKENADF